MHYIFKAVEKASAASVRKYLSEGGDPNLETDSGYTLLHAATEHSSPEIVKMLIEAKANVQAHDRRGLPPLQLASSANIPLLIQAGADVNEVGEYGVTALSEALIDRRDKGAQALLRAGATLSDIGWSRILEHADVGHVMSLLAETGQINFRDGQGNTALIAASKEGLHDLGRLLIVSGIDINARNRDGDTALHCALRYLAEQLDIARDAEAVPGMLLDSGANASMINFEGETALHLAARGDDTGTVKRLLELGADANARDACGDTPLHVASRLGRPDIADLLVGAGAEVSARDRSGRTASDLNDARLKPFHSMR